MRPYCQLLLFVVSLGSRADETTLEKFCLALDFQWNGNSAADTCGLKLEAASCFQTRLRRIPQPQGVATCFKIPFDVQPTTTNNPAKSESTFTFQAYKPYACGPNRAVARLHRIGHQLAIAVDPRANYLIFQYCKKDLPKANHLTGFTFRIKPSMPLLLAYSHVQSAVVNYLAGICF